MPHLTEEEILRTARVDRASVAPGHGLAEDRRSHLTVCAACSTRISGMRELASALRSTEPEVRPPSFDALIAPALTTERAAPTARTSSRTQSLSAWDTARLVASLVWWQARLVPASLWPTAAAALVALFVFAWRVPDPSIGTLLFGPGVILLTVGAALAVCSPRRDPGSELFHTMRVPPPVVWLTRLMLVMGVVLAASVAVSVAVTAVSPSSQSTATLIGSWLGPAVLGAGFTVFGTVWRSPTVGTALGTGSWSMSVAGSHGASLLIPLPSEIRHVIVALWATTPLSLVVAAVLLAAATWLVSRPERSLGEGPVG